MVSGCFNIDKVIPENTYQPLRRTSTTLIAFMRLLNLTDQSLLSLRTPMVKAVPIGGCHGLEVLGTQVVALRNLPMMIFLIDVFQKAIVLFCREILLCQKDKLFTSIHWVKPARLAEPKFLISTLRMAALRGRWQSQPVGL